MIVLRGQTTQWWYLSCFTRKLSRRTDLICVPRGVSVKRFEDGFFDSRIVR